MINTIKSTLPNVLTMGRLVVALLIAMIYSADLPHKYPVIFLLYLVSSISDFFDGYLSRLFKTTSTLGACFDPISDKVLLAVCLIILVASGVTGPFIPCLILIREFIVAGVREFLGTCNVVIKVTSVAKYKTATQMLGTNMFLWGLSGVFVGSYQAMIYRYAYFFLIISAVLTCYTGVLYCVNNCKHFKS